MNKDPSGCFPAVRLASASPRRLLLLRQMGIEPEVMPASIDESRQRGEAVVDFALRLALSKAKSGLSIPGKGVVLGADTVVFLGEELFDKPITAGKAAVTLERLSGCCHQVATAIAVCRLDQGECQQRIIFSQVCMKHLSAQEITDYVASGEPLDKAGAYAIQGRGAAFITRLEGSYTNVVGLPLQETMALLRMSCRHV
jgi:septum formation protein